MKQYLKVIFFICCFGNAFCQTNAIVLNENFENTSLVEVFDLLKNKYQVLVAYDFEAIQNIKITMKLEDVELESGVADLLNGTNLEFHISSRDRVLVRKKSLTKNNIPNLKSFEINGRVIDAYSGEPLSYANIFCKALNIGTSAQEDGTFRLEVKTHEPQLQLNFQYLGYENKNFAVQLDHAPFRLVAGLKPQIHEFQQVTVLEKLPTLSTANYEGALSLRTASLDALPSFVGGKDLFKTLQLLPGISAHDDLSAGLIIRGGGSDENLVVLDGITLYNVNHFFGIFSAINPNVVEKVNIYKNAFPIEYGARTSGVVEMESNQLAPLVRGGLELNLLTSNAWVQLPLSNNMELMVGGRITNQDLGETSLFDLANQEVNLPPGNQNNNLSRSQFVTANPNFKFYDANIKWTWKPSKNSLLKANFFRGYDEYQYLYEEQFTNRQGALEVNNSEYFNEDAKWSNTGFSLQWQQQWSSKFQSEFCFSTSQHETGLDLGVGILRDGPVVQDTVELEGFQYNTIEQYDFNWKNRIEINERQNLTFGYNYTFQKIDAKIGNERHTLFEADEQAYHQSLYLEYRHSLFEKTQISLGMRGTYYGGTASFYWSPRVRLNQEVNEEFNLKAAYSKNYQYLRQASHENRFGRTLEFWVLAKEKAHPVANSNNYMVGFNYFNDFFELDVEFFHKYTEEIMEFSLIRPGFDGNKPKPGLPADYRFFKGNRTAKGIDVLLKKHSGNYSGWVAYTLSKTTDKFKQINRNEPFASEYDRRHQLSFVNQYRLGNWDFSTTYIFASGKPYIDLALLNQSDKPREELNIGSLQSRLPAYHRIDIGANYNFKIKSLKSNIGLSIFNLLNRNNVKYRQFVHAIPEGPNGNEQHTVIGSDLELLGLTPNLTFGVEF